MIPLAKQRRTITFLGRAALTAYAAAILTFGAGMISNQTEMRGAAIGIGLIGIACDMRHFTLAAIARLVYNMSLWDHAAEDDPQHRRDPPSPEVSA